MSLLRQTAKHLLTALLPRRCWLCRGPRGCGGVALTFDDGPHPEHTPRLLDELARLDARATFFVVGQRVLEHPELVRRIVAEGHLIGNHTFRHTEPRHTTARQFLDEVAQTRRLLRDVAGLDTRLCRPPKGQVTWSKVSGLWRMEQTVALWNVDPRDYARTQADELRAWVECYTPRSGDVVLLHDNHPHAASVLEDLVTRIRGAHLACQTLDAWLPGSVRRVPAPLPGVC